MPVGKHRPKHLPVGSRPATCDICGVLWYNNKLTRKADGKLYCPDDVPGADSVTLSEANARDSAYAMRRDAQRQNEGSTDESTSEIEVTPAVLEDNLSGWWGYRNLRLGGGVIEATNEPFASTKNPGSLFQNDRTTRPDFDGDNNIEFDGDGDFMLSTFKGFVASGDLPSVWAVGNFDNPGSGSADTMFTISDVGSFMTYSAAAPNRIFLQAQSGSVTAGFYTNTGLVTAVFSPFTSTDNHLWRLELRSDRVVLHLDGTEVAETLSAGISSLPFTYVFMGAGIEGTTKGNEVDTSSHNGRCNEMVLSRSTVTAANVTDLETYFGRNFPEITIS